MSERRRALAARRNALRSHCEVQRNHIAEVSRQIEARLGHVDRGVGAIRRYARQPLLLAAGVGLILLLRPRRILQWVSRGAFLFATGRRLLGLIRR